jgi:uncharacterized protein
MELMNLIEEFELLLIPGLSWLIAQSIKFAITLRKDGLQLRDMYTSGGFPSAHTAVLSSFVTIIGVRNGIKDQLFALSFLLMCVVMYDAVGVRRSTGEIGAALKEYASAKSYSFKTPFHAARGHQPLEVLGGLVLGVAVGLFYMFVFVR